MESSCSFKSLKSDENLKTIFDAIYKRGGLLERWKRREGYERWDILHQARKGSCGQRSL